MTEIKGYNPDDSIKICGDERKRPLANLNQSSGPAFSIFEDDELLGCGGVRIYGMGEAWCTFTRYAKTQKKMTILKATRQQLDLIIREHKLWRLFAESEFNSTFLKHLGFEKKDLFVR